MHISYRKIFRYIFHLSLKSPITELLDVFGIVAIKDNICKIRESVVRRNLSSRLYKISMLMSYVLRDEYVQVKCDMKFFILAFFIFLCA